MRGVIVTGPRATGKTTAVRDLVLHHGFWTPTDVTTRPVAADESEMAHVSEAEFREAVLASRLVAPLKYGAWWFAWRAADVRRLVEAEGRAVVTATPPSALLLGAIVPTLVPVWLDAPPEVRAARLETRGTARDRDRDAAALRAADDAADSVYRPLFRCVVESGPETVATLLEFSAANEVP